MMKDSETPPALPEMATQDRSEETPNQEPKVVRDRTYYERKISSVIANGSAYLATKVKPDHIFRLNGQTVDLATLRRFELDQTYNNEVMALLIATCEHRGDWACGLRDVETRHLPSTIKNVLYLVDGEQWWFLIHVNLNDNVLTHYTAAGHDDELVRKSVDEILTIHQRRKKKAMTVHEVRFNAAACLTGIAVTSHNSGVMIWCQLEILLGLAGPIHRHSISEARLRYVSQ